MKQAAPRFWGGTEIGPHIKTVLERSTIDDLNLHYFISLFAAWNAIDTFFVFVIVLISHPAWAPDSACDRVLWTAQQDSEPVNMKHRHYGKLNFFYLCHFFPLMSSFFVCVPALLLGRMKISSQVLWLLRGERSMKTPSWAFLGDCTIKADITTYHFWRETKNETLALLISLFMHRVFSN